MKILAFPPLQLMQQWEDRDYSPGSIQMMKIEDNSENVVQGEKSKNKQNVA